ncbi:MAG: hypothetical protein IPM37_05300 [Hahellaceae bacterium]|jgi:hypothetical protein|nr:hypothetical protein [Hahellaceae bacterium]
MNIRVMTDERQQDSPAQVPQQEGLSATTQVRLSRQNGDREGEPQSVAPKSIEQAQIRILLASYSDILFVIMPFIVVLVLKSFKVPVVAVLASPEWALASAVLGGLAVVKLMLGLVSHDKMTRYRERLVFMVAATTFLLLMPSLLLAGIAYVMETPPTFLVYIHPVLLIVAIAVYSGSVQSAQSLLKKEED